MKVPPGSSEARAPAKQAGGRDGGENSVHVGPDRADLPLVQIPPGGSQEFSRYLEWRRGFSKHFAFKWGQRLGRDECPYMRRWALIAGLFSIRVHHFYRSDDERAFHDHPWWFITLVFKGGYTDVSPKGEDHLGPGCIRFRPALHRHTVRTDPGGSWSLVLTGPNLRTWGFWPGGKFVKSNKWFFANGHHPCDQP